MTDANTNADTTVGSTPDPATDTLLVEEAGDLAERVVENIETVIVGKRDAIEHLMVAVLSRGHLLLEDVPGVGKTMLARAVAQSVDGRFRRVQFTPDLLPTDITGVNVFNEKTREFEFKEGPIFANVVLADEINRAPPKTQSALLEAMEEDQVTADGETRAVPDPFIVIATQNSVERDRTYDLPVAEVDRFMKKLHLGYPNESEESEVLRRVVGGHPIDDISPVASIEELRSAREITASVTVEEPVRNYVTRLAAFTRDQASLGVSPRGGIALLRAAQGRAVLNGRDYVVPDDVKAETELVFTHRVRAEPSSQLGDETAADVVEKALERVRPE
ncbi:MAG: AAA family ATPase [Halobacteriaceae archaeon]